MYRLKTQPGEEHDKMSVGCNGLLAAVKAQLVADETGLVVVLEREFHFPDARGNDRYQWMPDEVMFPRVAS